MFRRLFLGVAIVGALILTSAASCEAHSGGCYRGYGGYHRAAHYPTYRRTHYHGGPRFYYGNPGVYSRRAYHGGYPGYYGGYRSGVSLSFGW